MRIDEVKLKNIGPHNELHVQFQSGLIGLLGSNGAGKSTLVNSIYAALTNDYSRFNAVKADIITNNTGKKSSYIQVAGSHHNQAFHLTRWLRPNKAELVISDKTYTKATDINQAIEDQLGISKLVIDRYVFVNQWEMFSFLSQTESERAKTFQYLCGTETAMQIHKVCTDYVSRQKGTEIVDNSVELEEAIDATQEQMDHHASEGRAAKKLILDDMMLAVQKKILKKATQAEEAAEALEHTEQLLGEARDAKAKAVARRKKVREQRIQDESKVTALANDPELASAKELLNDPEDYDMLERHRKQLVEAIEKLKEKIDEVEGNKPKKQRDLYLSEKERQEFEARKGKLEFQQQQDKDLVMDFDPESDDDKRCPYCSQTISDDYLDDCIKEYRQREIELEQVEKALKHSREYDKRLETYKSNMKSLTEGLVQLEDDLSEKVVKLKKRPDAASIANAREIVEEFESAQYRIAEADELIRTLDQRISKYEGRIESLEGNIEAYQKQIDEKPNDEAVVQASKKLEQHDDAVVKHKVALGCFKDAKQNRNKLRQTLDQLKLRLKEKAKIRDLLATISEAGDVFHWNNLPKTVSQANLELLVDDINDNLSMFSDPFYVEADEDLTFKVYFPGKSPVKAKQLSGGQKVILAIAFRSALDRVFGHDVGMMFLDEPTAGLDADNVEYFHNALQQLAQKVHGNRQLVVITHVQELGEVFDQLIEI